MSRPSKIDKLGAEVKKAIARWRDGGMTIDEIRATLDEEFGVEVSRSGLGRHVQEYDLMVAEIRASREAATQIVGELGDVPDDAVTRLNQEMTETLISKLIRSARGDDGAVNPLLVKLLAETQRNLAQAKKHGFEVEVAKSKWLDEQRRKLAEIEAASAKKNGGKADPVEVLQQIRERVYGLFDD
jgi:hypothetical protein